MIDFDKALLEGIDQNMVCFDQDSAVGELSWRVLCTMCTVMLKKLHDELITIYVQKGAVFGESLNEFNTHNKEFFNTIEVDDNLTGKYLSQDSRNALAPGGDVFIVIGVGKNGKILLGSC